MIGGWCADEDIVQLPLVKEVGDHGHLAKKWRELGLSCPPEFACADGGDKKDLRERVDLAGQVVFEMFLVEGVLSLVV